MPRIRVIDFETTGMTPETGEVVELGYADLIQEVDGTWFVDYPRDFLFGVKSIPPETRAVHHITMAEVEGRDPFHVEDWLALPAGCTVVAAHNMSFEDQWLQTEGKVAALCTLKAALRVWPDAPGHSNGVLRYWLEDQGLLSLDHNTAMPPHRAGPDAYVTAHILKALLAAGATGRDMVAWTKEPRVLPKCPIGAEWRGKPWADVDAGFLRWMLGNATMEADLKWNAQRELDRRAGR